MDDVRRLNDGLVSADKANDVATKKIIERALDLSSLNDGSDKQDFMNNAQRAFKELLDLRNENKMQSQSIPLRNAEYYVMGYYAGLANDQYLSFGVDFGEAYMALKWAAMQSKFTEPWVRSNPDLPASPPGGTDWAKAGLLDGRLLRDTWTTVPEAKLRKRSNPQ